MPVTYKILVCRMGAGPELVEVESPFKWAKKLLGGEDAYIEVAYLDDGVQIFLDEDGIGKGLGINRLIPARAPVVPEGVFVIDMTDGRAAPPGTIGYHEIRGDFILTRHNLREDEPESLTPEDIQKYTTLLGGLPPCPNCGNKPAYAGAVYCGAECAAEAGA